mgnify:FL=1
MSRGRVEHLTEQMALPVVEDLNCELVDVEYKKEVSQWYLRIYIDKQPDGVTVEDCQELSERVGKLLDESDPIPHSYFLEVSSPGLDRILKKDADFERYKGSRVDVSLYRSRKGIKKFTGELIGWKDDQLVIRDQEKVYSFPRSEVAVVRLSIEF